MVKLLVQDGGAYLDLVVDCGDYYESITPISEKSIWFLTQNTIPYTISKDKVDFSDWTKLEGSPKLLEIIHGE